MARATASVVGSTTTGSKPEVLIALSGSFNPWPVIVAVKMLPAGMRPDLTHLMMPANAAALAGSTKIPSVRAMVRYAWRISSSVTLSMNPLDSLMASVAPCQLAGLPMRMAEATVAGLATGLPSTMGAAPAAWKPNMRGSVLVTPAAWYSLKPFQYAV